MLIIITVRSFSFTRSRELYISLKGSLLIVIMIHVREHETYQGIIVTLHELLFV